jgi:hypothetical protein
MNRRHKLTLEKIFEIPERSDISWTSIESLIKSIGGELSEGRGSRVRVVLNNVKAVFHRPHPHKETNKGAVKSVKRFLIEAGIKL